MGDILQQLSELGETFGPFFFAILFIIFITTKAHKYYYAVCSRTDPVASEAERSTYKHYFWINVWCGIILTVAAMGWWFYYQTKGNYIYQVAITEIAPNIRIEASYFTKQTLHPSNVVTQTIADDFFLVVQDHPFKIGDKFSFIVYLLPPSPSAPTNIAQPLGGEVTAQRSVEIKYRGNFQDSFKLIVEPSNDVKLLVLDKSNNFNGSFFTRGEIKLATRINSLFGHRS